MATVKELIEALREFPDDHVVVLASDAEGNEFHEADGLVGFGYWEDGEYGIPAADEAPSNSVSIWPVG